MDQITDKLKKSFYYTDTNASIYSFSFSMKIGLGNNFPADSKFGKIKDNLRLTNTTHIHMENIVDLKHLW